MNNIHRLVEIIDPQRPLFVQAHNFPDHDAVATAFALQHLLSLRGVLARSCYRGSIQSQSLRDLIDSLDIPISYAKELNLDKHAQIIVVDSLSGGSNVKDLEAEVIGVIDHHKLPYAPTCRYVDIREEYGACSTILYEYYRDAGEQIPQKVASALLVGIMMDTSFITRGVSSADLGALNNLFNSADWENSCRLLRNSLSVEDIRVFEMALRQAKITDAFCYIHIDIPCTIEVLALIADFFLTMREIHFVVAVMYVGKGKCRISVRSEDATRPADVAIGKALKGIGEGGGHMHMGGGVIESENYPGNRNLYEKWAKAYSNIYE